MCVISSHSFMKIKRRDFNFKKIKGIWSCVVVTVLGWKIALNFTRAFLHNACPNHPYSTSLVTFKPKPQPET